MTSIARSLHKKAEEAREKEQFIKSFTYNDEALFAYDKEDDALGFSEAIASRAVTLRVYANLHNTKRLLMLAKYNMLASVEIARQSGTKEALALPLFNLAQVQEDLGEFGEAVEGYKEAVSCMENSPEAMHNRPSVVANMHVHMYACEYKAGDKSALERAKKALRELEASDEPDAYAKAVWVSGGYMRIAVAIKNDQPEEAENCLEKAKKIIEENPALTIRKKQLQKLLSS